MKFLRHIEVAARNLLNILQRSSSRRDSAIIIAIAAALSLYNSGFVFGIRNNAFHLPIVAALYDEPQYANDAFIQSLRYFSSGIWLILSGWDRHIGYTESLFLGLSYLSRAVTFTGFLCCAALVGINSRFQQVVFCLLLCFLAFLDGFSSAGAGGLFLNYFTHSEIANGTTLLAIYYGARGKIVASLTMLGATIFINVFMAIWLVPPLFLIMLSLIKSGKMTFRQIVVKLLIGLIPIIIFAGPILFTILSNPDFGKPASFDFITYLREYFPIHFLIDSNSSADLIYLFSVALLGALSIQRLQPQAAELRIAYVGAIAVYLIGAIAPYITHDPRVLSLHLLRSSANIHLLAAFSSTAIATLWICDSNKKNLFVLGCLLAFFLNADKFSFVLGIPIIAISYLVKPAQASQSGRLGILIPLGCLLLAALPITAWPKAILQHSKVNREYAGTSEWERIGRWAMKTTPLDSVFLIPPGDSKNVSQSNEADEISPASLSSPIFEFVSHRQVWIDFRRGAAVLWAPTYYSIWRRRLSEVQGLVTPADRLAYARRNGINYLVEPCSELPPHAAIAFMAGDLCVISSGVVGGL